MIPLQGCHRSELFKMSLSDEAPDKLSLVNPLLIKIIFNHFQNSHKGHYTIILTPSRLNGTHENNWRPHIERNLWTVTRDHDETCASSAICLTLSRSEL